MLTFNPLLQMSSGVHFSLFGSFVFGMPGFPLSDVPSQPGSSALRRFVRAHRVMEANEARGKIVVVHS